MLHKKQSSRSALLVLLVTTVLLCILSIVQEVECGGDDGIDRYGLDLPGMPIQVKSADDCEVLCNQDEKCAAWSYSKNGGGCGTGNSGCWLKSPVPPLSQNECRVSGVKGRRLLAPTWSSFPVGIVRPQGWILSQLNNQATGLAGYLGNKTDAGGLDERVPYWLNGQVPLMFLINGTDVGPRITKQVERYLNYILDHQNPQTGWFGSDCCDPWPRFYLLLSFIQYMEGNPQTQPRIIPKMELFYQGLQKLLLKQPLSSWAGYRWQDLLLSVYWMIDYHTQHQNNSQLNFYFDLAEIIEQQGFDWATFFNSPQFPREACRGGCPSLATHGVNVGEAIKSAAVWHRQAHSILDYYSTIQRLSVLDEFHGQPSGMFSCSEHLAGLNPSQGTETCTVVETMYSYEYIFEVFGNLSHADRCEQIAYNALPAALTGDMWAHVYLQQNNQINSQTNNPNIYVTDGPDSNIYGLAPNYGCCTVNFPQGWPKFVVRMYMRPQNDVNGLGVIYYGPSAIQTTLGSNNNNPIKISTDTLYPFEENIVYSVSCASSFNLYFRVPEWANSKANVQVGSNKPQTLQPGTLAQVQIPAGSSRVVLSLPMEFRLVPGINGSVTIHRGPLIYSLYIPNKWTLLNHYAFNSSDWQIEPLSDWNYGVKVNMNNPNDGSLQFFSKGSVGDRPWTDYESPVYVKAKGRIVPQWKEVDGAADWMPQSPVQGTGPLVDLTLYPLGANKIRISDFPVLSN